MRSSTGVDLTGLVGGGAGTESEEALDCQTGADANASTECLMVGAADSLDLYWARTAPQISSR